jgi:uncharacterized protein (DUF1810 family)
MSQAIVADEAGFAPQVKSQMDDPHNLQRFVDAQEGSFEDAREELRRGRKTSHWMWFIFPQIEGLGSSDMSQRYAIHSVEEARAYLAHQLLGPRLRECTGLVNSHKNANENRSIHQILGYPDDLKFKSSMTLFAHATEDDAVFVEALRLFFDGEFDQLTVDRFVSRNR